MKKLFLGALLLFLLPYALAETNISSCGTFIPAPDYYVINETLHIPFGTNCIDVTINDATFDCQGNIIEGDNNVGTGVYNWDLGGGYRNTYKNCIFQNITGSGIYFERGSDANVINCTFINVDGGLGVTVGNGLHIINNTFRNVRIAPISFGWLYGYNIVTGNYFDALTTPIILGNENNLIYNNVFMAGNTSITFSNTGTNRFNLSAHAGQRIIGGGLVGGNYWNDPACVDANNDGFCDSPELLIENNTDWLPLSTNFMASTATPTPVTELTKQSETTSCTNSTTLQTTTFYAYCGNTTCVSTPLSMNETCQYGCVSDQIPNICAPAPSQVNIMFLVIVFIAALLLGGGYLYVRGH